MWRNEAELGSSAPSEVTITHRRAPPPPPTAEPPPPPVGRNPVVDRLTGRNNMVGEAAYGTVSGGLESQRASGGGRWGGMSTNLD